MAVEVTVVYAHWPLWRTGAAQRKGEELVGVVRQVEPGEEVGGASWMVGEEVGLEEEGLELEEVELLLPLHLKRLWCKGQWVGGHQC